MDVGYGEPAMILVTAKRGTLADEGVCYAALFGDSEVVLMTDIATVEIWLTLEACNIADEEGGPILQNRMPYDDFLAGLTVIWEHDANIFWEIHNIVREVNPQWKPEGND